MTTEYSPYTVYGIYIVVLILYCSLFNIADKNPREVWGINKKIN